MAEALERAEAERPSFVAAECGADDRLHEETRSLLAFAEEAATLYETPMFDPVSIRAVVPDAEQEASVLIGQRIGPYKVVRELGRGGMGTAYLAERDDTTFEKRVAIKLIKRGMDTDGILRRFRDERQILAILNHPNIATLFDGGSTTDGRPYVVMEYIDGLQVDTYCERRQLSVRDRLKLFQQVCRAVHHAHENRIVHRDLKPGNILVTTAGIPKLLDFGIAKLIDSDGDSPTLITTVAGRPMTPQYSSPEQIRGEPITPSSDVYSLGVLLYTLMTGRLPYRLEGCTPAEAERIVCHEEPAEPSAVVGSVTATADGGRGRRDLRGDVDAIAMMALRKEPARRYSSALALADDIDRHLAGLPIAARRSRVRDRVWILARRTKARAAAVALAAAVIALVFVAVDRLAPRSPNSTAAPPIGSLAVLPLVNVGRDPELDFMVEGITDGLINRLSGVPQLKVIARDSAYRYQGSPGDYRDVARQLGVRAVLAGDVALSGGNVLVSVRLIDAGSQRPLWTRRYEQPPAQIQVLESSVAQGVVDYLRLPLSEALRTRFGQAFTADSEAYQLYLRGRYVWNKRRAADFRKSIGYFQQALERDPRFALAHSGLADAYSLLTEYHAEPASDTYPKAKQAALAALALDKDLAEAHSSLAYVEQFYEWDWVAAEGEFRRAIELNPNYATAHQWFAEFLAAMGRNDEALASIRRATQLDPLSLIINSVEANLLYMARRYDEAIAKGHQIIAMESDFPEVHEYLKRSYDQKGLYAQAIAARQTRRRLLGRPADETPALRAAASTTVHAVYWRNRLAQELSEGIDEGLQPFEMAEIMSQVGDKGRALDWLERACNEHDFMVMYVRVAPNLDPLRGDARFQKLLQRRCRVVEQ